MQKLISEHQANGYYGNISDNIEKYKSRENVQITSADLPLFVDQIGRLRDIFQKILTTIDDPNIEASTKLGTKLNNIITTYPPSNTNINQYIFNSWEKVNQARHYQQVKVNMNIADYKKTLKNICDFICEYSGVSVPEKIYKFYINRQPSGYLDITPKAQTDQQPKLRESQLKSVLLTPRQKKLWTIPDTRLPILFVLDVSLSMSNEKRIEDLNKGVKYFYKSMQTDEITSDSVELGIITFGHEVNQLLEFSSIDMSEDTFNKLQIEATGNYTRLGEAMLKAIDITDKVKAEYSDASLSYHQPWIVLITDCDGQGIDDYEEAAKKVSEKIKIDNLVLFPIAVGLGNLEILTAFSPNRDPLLMRNKKFGEFFNWLQENALFISRSRPDENKPLSSPKGWSNI